MRAVGGIGYGHDGCPVTDLEPLIVACRDLLDHRKTQRPIERELIDRKDEQLARIVREEHLSLSRAHAVVYHALIGAGMTDEEIDIVGVGASAVRLAVDKGKGER